MICKRCLFDIPEDSGAHICVKHPDGAEEVNIFSSQQGKNRIYYTPPGITNEDIFRGIQKPDT